MFYLSGIFITFFLAVLLFSKKGKTPADIILAAWLVLCGFHLTLFYLYISDSYEQFTAFLGLEQGLPLFHGPFLLLYIISLTQGRKIRWYGWFHFLPGLLVFVLLIPFFSATAAEKISVYRRQGEGYHWLTDILFYVIIGSGIIYVFLCFVQLRRHRVAIQNEFSNTARVNLNWVRYLIYGICVIWVVVIIGLDDAYVFAAVVVYMFFIGYFGIRQVGIFTDHQHHPDVNQVAAPELQLVVQADPTSGTATLSGDKEGRSKYQNSNLSEEQARLIYERLAQLMNGERLFREPELTISDLSTRLGVTSHILSQVINSLEGKSFYDYINGLRVEEFKRLLTDSNNHRYTMLSLAFDCGFNSKTAFNRNFKKSTGLSPSAFLRQTKISLP